MLPFKKILCSTDFSEPSYEALDVASELALHFGSTLCLVHVVSLTPVVAGPVAPMSFDVVSYQRALEESALRQLQEVVEKRILSKGLKSSRPFVVSGIAADEIVRIAGEEKCDLIVIASHGLTGWRRVVFGSVTGKIVRTAPCPVLTIRPRHQPLATPITP